MYKLLPELYEKIISLDTLHAKFLASSLMEISAVLAESAEIYIAYRMAQGDCLDTLAKEYLSFLNETRKETEYFMARRRYRLTSFSEAKKAVYDDSGYMQTYMSGLAISNFLWRQHQCIFEFFISSLKSRSNGIGRPRTYFEVGPGHGLFFSHAAKFGQFDKLIGIDISKKSIEVTKKAVGYFIEDMTKIHLHLGDFFSYEPNEKYDFLVMGEVLEHVEDPAVFLRCLAGKSAPQSYSFISTCLNAPAPDHIFNFDTPEMVEDMINESGFDVAEKLILPYGNKTAAQCLKLGLPINMAYLLRLI